MTGDPHSDESSDIERLHRLLHSGPVDEVVAGARWGLANTPYHEDYRALLIAGLIALDDVDGALDQAQFGVSELPGSARMYRMLARVHLAARRWVEAVHASDEARRLAPDDAVSILLSAQAQTAFAASLADNSKEQRSVLRAAKGAATAAASAAPSSTEPLLLAARIGLLGRDWSDARVAAERTLAVDPECAEAHMLLGEALLGSGDVAAAGDEAALAVRGDPTRLDFAELLDHVGPPIWQWSVAGMLVFVPVASALDGSFEAWMAVSGVLGAGALAWLKFAPSNRISKEAAELRRGSRRR